eukprot:TRINITY_DN106783_c0_g1_i1.p1 TRINITY_DN106783_c0_g1~~TRINITY_DN106783_c0_g1_i1.p1  ORF type:complete len:466 (+),score=42.17 TRINITY_DN106783_c0_g1_i1:105-1502(+)
MQSPSAAMPFVNWRWMWTRSPERGQSAHPPDRSRPPPERRELLRQLLQQERQQLQPPRSASLPADSKVPSASSGRQSQLFRRVTGKSPDPRGNGLLAWGVQGGVSAPVTPCRPTRAGDSSCSPQAVSRSTRWMLRCEGPGWQASSQSSNLAGSKHVDPLHATRIARRLIGKTPDPRVQARSQSAEGVVIRRSNCQGLLKQILHSGKDSDIPGTCEQVTGPRRHVPAPSRGFAHGRSCSTSRQCHQDLRTDTSRNNNKLESGTRRLHGKAPDPQMQGRSKSAEGVVIHGLHCQGLYKQLLHSGRGSDIHGTSNKVTGSRLRVPAQSRGCTRGQNCSTGRWAGLDSNRSRDADAGFATRAAAANPKKRPAAANAAAPKPKHQCQARPVQSSVPDSHHVTRMRRHHDDSLDEATKILVSLQQSLRSRAGRGPRGALAEKKTHQQQGLLANLDRLVDRSKNVRRHQKSK